MFSDKDSEKTKQFECFLADVLSYIVEKYAKSDTPSVGLFIQEFFKRLFQKMLDIKSTGKIHDAITMISFMVYLKCGKSCYEKLRDLLPAFSSVSSLYRNG